MVKQVKNIVFDPFDRHLSDRDGWKPSLSEGGLFEARILVGILGWDIPKGCQIDLKTIIKWPKWPFYKVFGRPFLGKPSNH